MKTKRLKLLAVWIAVLGIVVVGATAFVCKDDLCELWLLHRLDSEDAEEALRACDSLRSRGSKRSVSRLAELGAVDGPLKETAIESLGGIFTREGRLVRLNILETLLDLCENGETTAARVLISVAPGEPSGYPRILERFRAFRTPAPQWPVPPLQRIQQWVNQPRIEHVSAAVLARGWPASQGALTEFFSDDEDLRASVRFLGLLSPFQAPPDALEAIPLEKTSALFRHFALEHPRPRIRALALSHAVVKGGPDTGNTGRSGRNRVAYDHEILRRVFESDRDLLVRRACVRIAGVLRPHAENLDMSRLLGEVRSSKLLVDIIQARTLWLGGYRQVSGFVLFDGTVCDWIPIQSSAVKSFPWSDTEITALQSILETERDPELRDAASLALAEPFRALVGGKKADEKFPLPVAVPALKVHEWGVWLDGPDSALVPVAEVVDELPEFVHRSETPSDELWAQRSYMPMTITKPVVHFYSPEPVSLFVQVQFHAGQPWTFFPEATDYAQSTKVVSWNRRQLRAGSLRRPTTKAGASQEVRVKTLEVEADVEGEGAPDETPAPASIVAPWLTKSEAERPSTVIPLGFPGSMGLPRGELARRYRVAPWLVPNHPLTASAAGPGPIEPESTGLEWCGLRVGFDEELEAEVEEPPVDHWWRHLREVPSDDVAVRGERENFLFYDGAANLPAPIQVRWKDEKRDTLLLKARSFDAYPDLDRKRFQPFTVRGHNGRKTEIPGAFLVHKLPDRAARGGFVANLSPDDPARPIRLDSLGLAEAELAGEFERVLQERGLTSEEARSLRQTWQSEFFETDGLRVITVLPQWIYDTAVPITILPRPDEIRRVGLVWRECDPLEVDREWGEQFETRRWEVKKRNLDFVEASLREIDHPIGDPEPYPKSTSGRRLSEEEESVTSVGMSDDGRHVVFAAETEATLRVVLADLESRILRELVRYENTVATRLGGVGISGDGRFVAFSIQDGEEMKVIRLNWQKRTRIEIDYPNAVTHERCMTRDGNRIAFASRRSARILDVRERRVYLAYHQPGFGRDIESLSLAAGGRRLAITAERDGNYEIYISDLDEQTAFNLSRSEGRERGVSISGDGERVIFESDRDSDREIYVADLGAGLLTNLSNSDGKDTVPRISVDGRFAIYRTDGRLHLVNIKTGEKRRLSGTSRAYSPATMSADADRIVYRHSSATTGGYKLYLLE